jgi:hypothetical protein
MVLNIRALKNNIRIYSMLPGGCRVLPGSGTYIAIDLSGSENGFDLKPFAEDCR